MPTNEERSRIASRLRNAEIENLSTYEYSTHLGEAIGECVRLVSGHEILVKRGLDRLAGLIEPEPINGETSDGYHTFNELYHHRALLFSVIVRNYSELCWKSKKHHAGDMYEGMFIIGINTPDGQASYHYDIDPYWDMFECEELEFAPEWDGHTPGQAIDRIGKLMRHEPETERTCKYIWDADRHVWFCSECGGLEPCSDSVNYCCDCGAKVIGNVE